MTAARMVVAIAYLLLAILVWCLGRLALARLRISEGRSISKQWDAHKAYGERFIEPRIAKLDSLSVDEKDDVLHEIEEWLCCGARLSKWSDDWQAKVK